MKGGNLTIKIKNKYKTMKKHIILFMMVVTFAMNVNAQVAKVYDEKIDPMVQIDNALNVAKQTDKYVVAQVGGNWCPWCLRFADFIKKDTAIAKVINDNFVYIHVNYDPRNKAVSPEKMLRRLGSPQRFGFPVLVVLDTDEKVIHIQDSSFLEEGKGYNQEKVLRFFSFWTPEAVTGSSKN